MVNNLQAKELNRLYKTSANLISEYIKIDNLDNLQKGSWIEIDSKSIEFYYLSSGELIAKSKLEALGEYLYLNSKTIKPKKLKKIKKEDTIRLQFALNKTLRVGKYAIAKMPIETTLEGQSFKAVANLYFKDRFLLEVKELL